MVQGRGVAAVQGAGAPVQYIRMRRPAKLGAAASIQARRSLKQRMRGSSVSTPSCRGAEHCNVAWTLVWGQYCSHYKFIA